MFDYKTDIIDRNITRICHFTKSRNFLRIINESKFIYSVKQMENGFCDINDTNRFDHCLDHINCSIQYPNIYYLNKVKNKDELFKDWAVLLLKPEILLKENTLVSPVNAATSQGKYITDINHGFSSLFVNEIESKRHLKRSLFMPSNVTTDLQAEVLIYQSIDIKFISGLLVSTKLQAEREFARLKVLGKDQDYSIFYSEEIFEPSKLMDMLHNGKIPEEIKYEK